MRSGTAVLRKNHFWVLTLQIILRIVSGEKTDALLDFVQITSTHPLPSPSAQFGQLVQLFLNAKNGDLSDIQNDPLSIFLIEGFLIE